MKRTVLFCFSLLVTLSMSLRTNAADASLLLSNPFVQNNLTHFTVTDPNNEPYTIQTTIGGLDCRQIPGSKYGYFNANDATVNTTQNNLIFTITYFDNGTDDIGFQYNATGGSNYSGMNIRKTNTNTWITATIALTDASLRNAQNNGADFRIGTTTGYNNYIREITVTLGALNPAAEPVPVTSGSAYSEFTGKSVAGYQVWFNTGTPAAGWFHWSGGAQPSVGHLNFEVYPDVTEYAASDFTQTGFANLGDGTSSQLFNSSNTTVVNKHFDWMQTKGIDGVALQRFINGIGSVINTSPAASPLKVKAAAEATNRIFYICYDISSTGLDATWDDIIKFDWVYNIEKNYALTSSPAYATVNNKPVVELWGTGFTGNHPGTEQETIDLINFLQARGCYVIGGVPTYWRTGTGDSKANFMNAYKEFDMISPWSVGRFGDVPGATNFKNDLMIPDKAFLDPLGIEYMPVLFPGFSWSQWNNGVPNMIPRKAGDFMWNQAVNIKNTGVQNMYFAMFDEYDEGTAIMKAATDYTMLPTDQYFVTTSADGIWTSSDFYLRVASAATEMLKGTRAITATVPIEYSLGPIYYRNSFEKRFATYDVGSGYFPIDPCFYNDATVSVTNVNAPSVAMENNPTYAKTGLFTTKITGSPTSAASSSYYYKLSDTKITVKANMQLSFWKYSLNSLGQFTSVDLVFQSGKRLSNLPVYADNNGYAMNPSIARGNLGVWEKVTCQIGVGQLIGDVITGVIIGYDSPAASGTFTAYFDDIIIEDALAIIPVQTPYLGTPWPIPGKIEAENFDEGGEGIAYHDVDVANKFNAYRLTEGVDVETTSDVGGGYNVGWIETGEWMEYSVNVVTAGTYTLEAKIASGNAGTKTLHVEMDGIDISGPISFTTSAGWQTFSISNVTTSALTLGNKIMRIYIDAGGFNLNYVNFIPSVALGINDSPTADGPTATKGKSSVLVVPNPIQGSTNASIHFVNQDAGEYRIKVYNYQGATVLQTYVQVNGSLSVHGLELPSQWSSGYYLVEVLSASGIRTVVRLGVE